MTDGKVLFLGSDFSDPIDQRDSATLRQLQMVFQNPDASLNPRHTIKTTLTRPLRRFQVVPQDQEEARIIELLHAVNLDEDYLDRLPRELSGGEKQRVAIARAFAGEPELVVCDEPISSLDVSVQAAVINLLRRLQRERRVALIFICARSEHGALCLGYGRRDLPGASVRDRPDRSHLQPAHASLYRGADLRDPGHRPLAEIIPIRLEGTVPSPANPPGGCRFHTRCPRKLGTICETEQPPGQTTGSGHTIFCHIPLAELTDLQTKPSSTVEQPTEA